MLEDKFFMCYQKNVTEVLLNNCPQWNPKIAYPEISPQTFFSFASWTALANNFFLPLRFDYVIEC